MKFSVEISEKARRGCPQISFRAKKYVIVHFLDLKQILASWTCQFS